MFVCIKVFVDNEYVGDSKVEIPNYRDEITLVNFGPEGEKVQLQVRLDPTPNSSQCQANEGEIS